MSNLTTEERDKLPLKDFGDPDNRKFPIVDQDDVDSAAHLIGKAEDPDAVKKRIISIAKRKDLTIPDAWKEKADMAAELTADDIRARLQDAIEKEFLQGDDEPDEVTQEALYSMWVTDLFPDSKRFVYRGPEGSLYERNYSMDQNGSISLIGNPQEVSRVTDYVPIVSKMNAANFEEEGEDYVYEGEIFRAGNYEDKKVDAKPCDLIGLAKSVVGKIVPIKIQHVSTAFDSALNGYGAEQIEARDNGAYLWGRVRIPKWIKDALGEDFAVSLGVSRNGLRPTGIRELSIVDCGRIPTARLTAAFASFAGKRHSDGDTTHIQAIHDHATELGAMCASGSQMSGKRHSDSDMADIQTMHDLAVSQGAICSMEDDNNTGEEETFNAHVPAKTGSRQAAQNPTMEKQILEKLMKADDATLESMGLKREEVTAEFEATKKAAKTQVTGTANPEILARLESAETQSAFFAKQLAIQRQRDLQLQGAVFADQVIKAEHRAMPNERDEIIELFVMAANADGKDGEAAFSDENGQLQEGVNIARVKAAYAKRPVLSHFNTEILDAKPHDDVQARQDERAGDAVFDATPVGRAARERKEAIEAKKKEVK